MLRFGRPILLLTDVVLPRTTVRDVAERLGEAHPGLVVLYMSGYSAEAIARRGNLGEGIDYLAKPFKGAELARRVRAALDRRGAAEG